MPDMIRLNTAKLEEQIGKLKKIQSSLENEIKISSLSFGCGAPADECRGCAAGSMRQMNEEMKACVEKFSLLVAATVQYLQNVKATFEEADSALGGP